VADVSVTGAPPPFTTSPGSTSHGAGEGIEASREAIREQYFGGARLLFSDARVVYLLLNEARSRAIARVFRNLRAEFGPRHDDRARHRRGGDSQESGASDQCSRDPGTATP